MKYLPVGKEVGKGLFRSKTLGSLKTSKNGTGENGASSGSTGTNTDGSSGTRRIFKRMGTSFGLDKKSPSKERTASPPPSPPDAEEIQADLDLENLQAQFGDEEDDLARAEEPSFVETLHEIVVGGTGMAELRPAAKELTKLGWKEQDLQTFSNPQLLSREPPERVCQMVQDWFSAHLAVADQGTQERLLVETLKPVVSG